MRSRLGKRLINLVIVIVELFYLFLLLATPFTTNVTLRTLFYILTGIFIILVIVGTIKFIKAILDI